MSKETNLRKKKDQDLNESPQTSSGSDGSKYSISDQPKLPEINPFIIHELEKEAHQMSKEFYKLSKQLQTKLNQISAASVCCMQTFNENIGKTCDSIDECANESNVLVQKANELSKSMEPVYKLQIKINSIKTVLNALETQI